MTPAELAIPQPVHVTAQQWEELPEDEGRRLEVVDGFIHVSPEPTLEHQDAVGLLFLALHRACPPGLKVLPGGAIRLGDDPLTVRVPDVLVIQGNARGGHALPHQVLLAVEVLSPGSVTVDRIHKRGEYAAAGIPNYWVLDILHGTPRLAAYHLEGGEYHGGDISGRPIVLERPFRVQVDLQPTGHAPAEQ